MQRKRIAARWFSSYDLGMWRDGMGRLTVKADTGSWARGAFTGRGVVRAPGWLQVHGPAVITLDASPDQLAQWADEARERMAARARRHRLPSHLRYERERDPRYWTED